MDGGAGNDTLYGDGGVDTLNGGSGDDLLFGGSSTDTLNGGTGRDTLDGGGGQDVLNGGSGRDIIEGGTGNDTMTGGQGVDTYIFDDGFGADIITDFTNNEDVLDFSAHSGFASLADVLAVTTQVGANVVINLSASNRLTLENFTLAGLDASDFEFAGGAANEVVGKPVFAPDDNFAFVEKALISDDLGGFTALIDGFSIPQDVLDTFLASVQAFDASQIFMGENGWLEISADIFNADFADYAL